jgi:ubiquitin-activating enzyme E1
MQKMANSNVLIVGMKGLGVEIGAALITPFQALQFPTVSLCTTAKGRVSGWREVRRHSRPRAHRSGRSGHAGAAPRPYPCSPAGERERVQFFLRPEDIGKPRDAAMEKRLAELNSYVPVSVLGGDLTEAAISRFQVWHPGL